MMDGGEEGGFFLFVGLVSTNNKTLSHGGYLNLRCSFKTQLKSEMGAAQHSTLTKFQI